MISPAEHRQAALAHPEVQKALKRASEFYIDGLLGFGDYPKEVFMEADDAALSALEDALLSVSLPAREDYAA